MSSEPLSVVPGDVVLMEDFCAIASFGKDDPAHSTFTAAYYADTGSFVQSSVDCITLCTKLPDWADQAFRLKMTTGADLIAGKFKLRGASYYYGVPADKVRQFSAPKDKKPIDEASIYVALKASNENVSSIVPLENTETVPFKTQFESILAHSPSFIESKLTSVGALENHAKRGYAKNIKAASTVAEKVERQAAKEKAAGDNGGVESAGGGRDAGERWAEVRANALSYEAVLELPFAQRFVVLDPKKPEEAQAALKGHPYEKELVADLPEFINYMSGRPSALSAQLTPFSKLLTEKFSFAPTAPEPESDGNLGAARGWSNHPDSVAQALAVAQPGEMRAQAQSDEAEMRSPEHLARAAGTSAGLFPEPDLPWGGLGFTFDNDSQVRRRSHLRLGQPQA